MSVLAPGQAPRTDGEWTVQTESRLRALENPRALRVGPWSLINDPLTGALKAMRPGQTVLIDETGATEIAAQSLDLSALSSFVTSDDLTSAIGAIPPPSLDGIAESLWSDLYAKLTGLLNPVDALTQLANFFKLELGGPISSGRLPLLPLSHIRDVTPNLLVDGSFDDESTLAGFPDWDYDETDGKSRPGCAYTMADGTTHTLHSNPIEVEAGDKLNIEAWAKWTGLVTSTPNPIQVAISSYRADDVLINNAPTVLSAVGGNGGTLGWTGGTVVTNWTPPANTAYVVLELTVAAGATAGAVKFDDGAVRKVGAFPQSYVSGLVGALQTAASNLQSLLNNIWSGVTRQLIDGDKGFPDIFEVLGQIPALNVLGVGGISSIGQAVTETWTQLWGGFAQAIGGGKSIADAANAAGNVAATADQAVQVGEWNNAILGIRNNKPFDSGMDPTAVSMFPMPAATVSGGEPPYLNATQASVPVAFWIAPEDATRGSVQWLGKGNANITALYIDVYRVDQTTGAWTLLVSSPDQYPQLTAGVKLCRWDMQTFNRQTVAHGDVLAFAWRVQGTGTHQVAMRFGLPTGDATQVPQRPSAIRTAANGGLVGNLTAAQAAAAYGGDVPWMAFGIVTGDVAPPYYAPRTTEYQTTGTGQVYNIPTWANYLDVVLISGAGAGHGGNGGNSVAGKGGAPGAWYTETLVRGVDFPANATQIVLDVGAVGVSPGTKESNGGNGGASTRQAIAGGKAAGTVAGGLGATQYVDGSNNSAGGSPGDITYQGKNYLGGAGGGGGRPGADGGAPGGGGGGGYGGIYGVAYAAGSGGRGGGWVTARVN